MVYDKASNCKGSQRGKGILMKRTRLRKSGRTMKIKVDYVQLMVRRPDGVTLLGQPIRVELAKKVRKEMFGNNPDVVPMPANKPRKKR